MRKHSQPRNVNGASTDKTNPSFKWASMLHLLDYHRWYHVKKVLVHKKHNEANNGTESDSILPDPCEHHLGAKNDTRGSTPIEQTTETNLSTKCSPLPSSPRAKSSRAARIRKLIAKEVTKRRGRHRRSSTCPIVSELQTNDYVHHRQETEDERVVAELINTDQVLTDTVEEGDKKCNLCSTMHIECQLGDRKEVREQGDQQLDQIKLLLQEIPDEAIDELSFDKNITRSTSVQHSKEFLDAMDVLSMNKQFFLRLLEDPGSSLRHHFLAQQAALATSSKAKSLAKFDSFPISHPSSSKATSNILLNRKQKLQNSEKNHGSNQTWPQKASTSHDSTQVVGKRLKDLRQKLKRAVKESRKERRRIAMDAILHKVPYGHKGLEESSTKDSPSVSMCESDLSFSPCSNKEGNNRNRRSSSLDECLDRYSQLFETTSSSREANKIKIDTPERSRLRVMDDDSCRRAQRGLGRIFSSPDLQVFLTHRSEDCDGNFYSRIPNRQIMSFNEKKVKEGISKEDLEKHLNNEETIIEDLSDKDVESPISLDVASCNDSSITAAQPPLMTTTESYVSSMPKADDQAHLTNPEEIILQDSESTQLPELSDDSPTFACTKVDDDQIHFSPEPVSPTLHHVQVASRDEAEFNYVKDILRLSGYTGTQLLGTWYSSDQPVDPSLFLELESCSLLEPHCSPSKQETHAHSNRLLLFDLINEILLAIYERSVSYWFAPLSSCSRTHPMPKGYRVLEEVWACINWYMGCSRSELDPSLDYITTRDLAKDDRWMNLQFDAECVGLEVEDLIFEDLLNELIC